MRLDSLDVILRDVPSATAFFRDTLGLALIASDELFAEFDAGGFQLMLSPEALVPTQTARGVILHFRVPDVAVALKATRSRGARVLLELTRTDWN